MEQHPVPQNVTTFQFRLIGDMTIKQFGYLAGGIILGYIFYKLPLPFFFTWPLAIGSGILGFGLAFVPVEERPMDIWIASFFKNVYSPTQYVWSREARSGSAGQKKPPVPTIITPAGTLKTGGQTEHPTAQTVPQTHEGQHPAGGYDVMIKQLVGLFSSLFKPTNTHAPTAKPVAKVGAVVVPPQHVAPIVSVKPTPSPTPQAVLSLDHVSDPFAWIKKLFHTSPKVGLSPGLEFNNALAPHQAPIVQPQPLVAPPQPAVVHATQNVTPPPAAGHQMDKLQGQLSESLAERERLEKELIALHQKMEQQTQTSAASQQPMRHAGTVPTTNTQTSVRVFTPESATKAGLPKLTTFPNIVTGIIKDYNGNLLPGILITVRDTTDTPLRALKTNKLGQFAASTPLPNGTYIVEIEDPKNTLVFDKVQIPLSGAVAPPIEVVSKSQKRVERDRLAREIFGNQPM